MRGATQCARRLRLLLRTLRTKLGKVSRPAVGDPITQLILGIFSRDVPESKAREALDRLRAAVVDYNELRVVPPIEMAEMVGSLPNARIKCEDLSRALNKIFAREHEVSLERLRGLSRKEVIQYLDGIDGLDAYSRARIRLLGLQQHAVPLDAAMWAYARRQGIVDKRCPLEEAQTFLERRLSEEEAPEFVALLEKQSWAELGGAVRAGEVDLISSVPPDRTARNMLRQIAAAREGAARPGGPHAGDGRPHAAPAAPVRRQTVGPAGTTPAAGGPGHTPAAEHKRAPARARRATRPPQAHSAARQTRRLTPASAKGARSGKPAGRAGAPRRSRRITRAKSA